LESRGASVRGLGNALAAFRAAAFPPRRRPCRTDSHRAPPERGTLRRMPRPVGIQCALRGCQEGRTRDRKHRMATDSEQENLDPPVLPAPTCSDDLRCPGCGYDLTGLTRDRCPECGASFDRTYLSLQQKQNVLLPWETRRQGSLARRIVSTCLAAWLHPVKYCNRISQRCHVKVDRPSGLIAGVIAMGLMLCLLYDLTSLGRMIFQEYWYWRGGRTLAKVAGMCFSTFITINGPGPRGLLGDPSEFVSPLLSCAVLSLCARKWFKERLGMLRSIDLFALLCVPALLWPSLYVIMHLLPFPASLGLFLLGMVYWVVFSYLASRTIMRMRRAGSAGVAAAALLTWGVIQFVVLLPF
jgi:hypothetical protein